MTYIKSIITGLLLGVISCGGLTIFLDLMYGEVPPISSTEEILTIKEVEHPFVKFAITELDNSLSELEWSSVDGTQIIETEEVSKIFEENGLHSSRNFWMEKSIQMIKSFEGLENESYKDSGGVWTIGYGHTGPEVGPGQKISDQEAELLLYEDYLDALKVVDKEVKVPLMECQRHALASFVFNCGVENLRMLINRTEKSNPAIDRLNDGNYDSIRVVMPLYNKCKGQVLNGLVKRRAAEVALFESCLPSSK